MLQNLEELDLNNADQVHAFTAGRVATKMAKMALLADIGSFTSMNCERVLDTLGPFCIDDLRYPKISARHVDGADPMLFRLELDLEQYLMESIELLNKCECKRKQCARIFHTFYSRYFGNNRPSIQQYKEAFRG